MIFTERTIRVTNGASQINSPIVLYKGDKNIKIRFKIVDCPYTYSKNVDNIIEVSEASYAQLVIKTPNDGVPIFSDVAETERGYVTFTITGEMIDEAKEVGKYSFQVRLLDDEQFSRITIPEVVDGIDVRDPIATEDISPTNEVDIAMVDYAVTTAAAPEDAFNSEGNYNKTTWGAGDRITAAKLNKIEAGIDGVNKKVANGGGSGTVDLSGYVTKETGNANQITFSDGQTFQTKLDTGILKGEKGDQGIQGIQGLKGDKGDKGDPGEQGIQGEKGDKGDKGQDGLTTAISVNGNTYTHSNGTIALPSYPTVPTNVSELTNDANYASETFVTNKIAEASLSGGEVDLSGYVTKETGNANQITFADGQTFQAKLEAGTLKGDKGEQGIQGIQGEKGDPGEKGEQGPKGDKGDQGEQGPKGDKGDAGEKGEKGDQGEQGPEGPQGSAGTNGTDGQTPNITIGTVTTLEPGTNATAEIIGATPNLTLNLGIPKGADGTGGAGGVDSDTILNTLMGGKKLRYLTQDEYDSLSDVEKQDETTVYNITDAEDHAHTHDNKDVLDTITSEWMNNITSSDAFATDEEVRQAINDIFGV